MERAKPKELAEETGWIRGQEFEDELLRYHILNMIDLQIKEITSLQREF
ncbi:MAG: hypothetical protein QXM25_00990 [Nitrososphaerales archaeon]